MARKQDKKPDKKAVGKAGKAAVDDRGESVSAMEPLLISESSRHRATLSDKVLRLTQRAAAFRSRLPEGLIEPLSSLVREMNCYYSNLIEGHNTHPIDIQRALFGETSTDPKKRDLQQEAVAHIAVQRWIDEGGLGAGSAGVANVLEIHRRFYEALPESLKWVENPETGERMPVLPVESRRGAVAWGSDWEPSLRFLPSLIKLDVPISGIQLSDRLHVRPTAGTVDRGRRSRRITPISPYTRS